MAPIDGGEPRKLRPGDSVAVDPSNGSVVILMNEAEGVRLERLISTGESSHIPIAKDTLLFGELAGNAIDQRGRIAVRVVVPHSWYWGGWRARSEDGQGRDARPERPEPT